MLCCVWVCWLYDLVCVYMIVCVVVFEWVLCCVCVGGWFDCMWFYLGGLLCSVTFDRLCLVVVVCVWCVFFVCVRCVCVCVCLLLVCVCWGSLCVGVYVLC